MRKVRFIWVFVLLLLLSACSAVPEMKEGKEPETDSFYENYHVIGTVDDALRPCVVGSKACLDWIIGQEEYEFSIRYRSGSISLMAHNEEGDGISILSQAPMQDGSYEVYSSTLGSYDAATKGFVATKFSTCFFYETGSGTVIPSYTDGQPNPEYDELYDRWLEEKDGG